MVRLRRFFVSGLSLNPTVRPPEKKKKKEKKNIVKRYSDINALTAIDILAI